MEQSFCLQEGTCGKTINEFISRVKYMGEVLQRSNNQLTMAPRSVPVAPKYTFLSFSSLRIQGTEGLFGTDVSASS